MISFTTAELNTLIAGFLWPLTRILGLLSVAPLFGNVAIPRLVKIGLGVMLALVISPTVPTLPAMDPMSLTGLLILVQQFLIGLAMGFVMRVVFACMELAGEMAGLSMGLGFATFFDPQTQGRSIAISQFLSLITILMYLVLNVHLALLATLAESFNTMPISDLPMNGRVFEQMALWGGKIFSTGVQMALPIVAALLIINVGLAVLARSAPQLNLFGIGFPVMLAVGFLMLAVVVPYLVTPLARLFQEGLEMVQLVATGAPATIPRGMPPR